MAKSYEQIATDHYLVAALWAEQDEDGNPWDDNFSISDFSKETREEAEETVEDFMEDAEEQGIDFDDYDAEQVGHDIWLTRNGHGAGFWDRGYGEEGEVMTNIANKLGEAYPYLDDDGELGIE